VPPHGIRAQGRAGNLNYLSKGYVQYDRSFISKGMDVDPHHGASSTLEYALADSALAVMAKSLGHADDAKLLEQRALNWRNVWDASVVDAPTGLRGFPRPRQIDGGWFSDVDGTIHAASVASTKARRGNTSGWLGRMCLAAAAMGGQKQALQRLDLFFDHDALVTDPGAVRKSWVVGPYSYYSQFRYNPNNEPDLHAPWMYTLMGQPWKTTTVLRAAETLFGNGPGGVTGNDDLGTMSAWYLFSALGIYPDAPGSGRFLLHAPRFARAEIDLPKAVRCVSRRLPPNRASVATCSQSAWMAVRSRACGWTGSSCKLLASWNSACRRSRIRRAGARMAVTCRVHLPMLRRKRTSDKKRLITIRLETPVWNTFRSAPRCTRRTRRPATPGRWSSSPRCSSCGDCSRR
jgi:hypothetical protein